MFNQLCSIVERHYAVPKIISHLRDAVPYSLGTEAMDSAYEAWPDMDELLDGFEMPHSTIAFDSKRECFVVSDVFPEQCGLYGARTVLHCQSLDMSNEVLPDEVKAHAPELPNDAVVITISKIYAVGKTMFGRVNFSGDVGLSFTVSKRKGMICDPSAMLQLETTRLSQAREEDRWDIFNFGREETLKAAVRAVECAIYAARAARTEHLPTKAPPKKTKRKLRLWDERAWVDV